MMTAEAIPTFRPRLSACTSQILANPRSCALFLDVDGTLLDLAATPKSVRVPDGLIATLQRLTLAFDGAVGIITGRLISEVDLLLAPLRLTASGVHGAELRGRDSQVSASRTVLVIGTGILAVEARRRSPHSGASGGQTAPLYVGSAA